MKNKFIVITTCYNVEPYIQLNVYMNKFQTYKNVLYVYVDDNSSDTTYQTLKKLTAGDDRFLLLQNPNNGSQGKAYLYAIEQLLNNDLLHDEDIIVEVDGDDWLSSTFVLEYLNDIYTDSNVWMTYGQYQLYPAGIVGGHYHSSINDQVDQNNLHRRYAFPFSHLKTYKYWLFNKIDKTHLIDPKTNEVYAAAWDHALCISMVEMAGKAHTYMCPDILYILNRSEDLKNEGTSRLGQQKDTEQRIRNMPIYSKIRKPKITFNLKGPGAPGGVFNYGLGNLLFQVATGLSLAKDNDAVVEFPQLSKSEYGNYDKNVFSKVYTSNTIHLKNKIVQSDFRYEDLKFEEGTIYEGYYQSEKFFTKNENYIRYMLTDNDSINKVLEKYPDITTDSVSLHIRRGDYVSLQDKHPLLNLEYYTKALELIPHKRIYVFSDDIKWCKENLQYQNMVFVENESDVFDLYAMSLCQNNIIANSTFSWWGAWLNKNTKKIVVAPKTWFGVSRNLSDEDIIPNTWIRL